MALNIPFPGQVPWADDQKIGSGLPSQTFKQYLSGLDADVRRFDGIVAGAGTAGNVLTSQGPGSDPAFLPLASNPAMAGGFINKLRNPNFEIVQRGTSGSIPSATAPITVDGWYVVPSGATVNWSQAYNADGLVSPHIRLNCASGMTQCLLAQRIEASIAAQLLTSTDQSQPVTAQFTILNNTGASITPSLQTIYATAGTDNWSSASVDVLANLQTIPNNSIGTVSYTFVPNNAAPGIRSGYQIGLLFNNGLNNSTGFACVLKADVRAAPGVPVGLNNSPPPPELRPISTELVFCQRYLHLMTMAGATVPSASAFGGAIATTQGVLFLPLKVRSRVPFTGSTLSNLAHFTTVDFATLAVLNPTSLLLTVSEVDSVTLQVNVAAGFTAGGVIDLRPVSTAATILFTGAEL